MVKQPSMSGIAVVGASSQIGQALLPRLASAGYAAYRIGRENSNGFEGMATHIFNKSNRSFSPHLDSIDAVISLAPLPIIEVVVNMVQSLGAKRIIAFCSTGRFSKIGSSSTLEQDFVVQQEQAEINFSRLCEANHIAWTLFRPTMIYGANADQSISFIMSIIRKFGFFVLPFGANGLRQPIHVNDLANACVSVIARETTFNKAYNLGGGEIMNFTELVKKIFQALGKKPFLILIPIWLYSYLITLARTFPKAMFIRKEMVERMFHDLITDNQAVMTDFNYAPQRFDLQRDANSK